MARKTEKAEEAEIDEAEIEERRIHARMLPIQEGQDPLLVGSDPNYVYKWFHATDPRHPSYFGLFNREHRVQGAFHSALIQPWRRCKETITERGERLIATEDGYVSGVPVPSDINPMKNNRIAETDRNGFITNGLNLVLMALPVSEWKICERLERERIDVKDKGLRNVRGDADLRESGGSLSKRLATGQKFGETDVLGSALYGLERSERRRGRAEINAGGIDNG